MKKTKNNAFVSIVVFAFFSILTASCSLIQGPGALPSGSLNITIKVPAGNNSASARSLAPRVVFPETTAIEINISGEGLETPISKAFQKNVATNSFDISIQDIPKGQKTVDIVAGLNTGDPSILDGLSSGSSEVNIVQGPNQVVVHLLPVAEKVGGSIQLGTGATADFDPIALGQLGKTMFFRLVPDSSSGETSISAGGYLFYQYYYGLNLPTDGSYIQIYDYKGNQLSDKIVKSDNYEGPGDVYEYFNYDGSPVDELYVGVYVPATAVPVTSIAGGIHAEKAGGTSSNYYNMRFDRGVIAQVIGSENLSYRAISDDTPISLHFSAPVTVSGLSVNNIITGPETIIPISGVSFNLSPDGRLLTLTPSVIQGWSVTTGMHISLGGVADKSNHMVDLSAQTDLQFGVGRTFYVDGLGGTHVGVVTDPNSGAGRKNNPFKYLDQLLASTSTGWFNSTSNSLTNIKVAGYAYDGSDASANTVSAGGTIDLSSDGTFAGLRIEGGYDSTWTVRDTVHTPSLIKGTSISGSTPLIHISAGTVDFSGFYVERNQAGSSDSDSVLVFMDDPTLSYPSHIRFHDNTLQQILLPSNPAGGASTTTMRIQGVNFSLYRNSFVGAKHDVNASAGAYSFGSHGIEITQSTVTGGILANNVVESGGINLSTATSYQSLNVTGLSTTGYAGTLIIVNNTMVAGKITEGAGATGYASIYRRNVIDFSAIASYSGYDVYAIANNVFASYNPWTEATPTLTTGGVADAALYFNYLGYPLSHFTHFSNNMFSEWPTGILYADGSVSAGYSGLGSGINNLSIGFNTATRYSDNASDTAFASNALISVDHDVYNHNGGFSPGGYAFSGFRVGYDSLPISMGGLNFSTGTTAYDELVNSATASGSYFNYSSVDTGVIDQLNIDRLGHTRTGTVTGWSMGAYETD